MKALALVLLVGQAAYAETTSVTTTERSTPVSCSEQGDMMVCSKTTVTAVTTTVTAPIPKRNLEKRKQRKENENV